MNKLLALAGAVVLVTACAGMGRDDGGKLDSGYASPDAAAFMGYHGPLNRQNNRDAD